MSDWEIAAAVGSVLSGIGGIASVAVAIILYHGQKKLSFQLAKYQTESTQQMQADQNKVTQQLHLESQRFSQRQLLIPLWEQLDGMRDVNPQDPVWPEVIRVANTLELIALCVESGIIERDVFDRAWGEMFLDQARKIMKCKGHHDDGRSGTDILNSNRAAREVYEELDRRDKSRSRLTPFNK